MVPSIAASGKLRQSNFGGKCSVTGKKLLEHSFISFLSFEIRELYSKWCPNLCSGWVVPKSKTSSTTMGFDWYFCSILDVREPNILGVGAFASHRNLYRKQKIRSKTPSFRNDGPKLKNTAPKVVFSRQIVFVDFIWQYKTHFITNFHEFFAGLFCVYLPKGSFK